MAEARFAAVRLGSLGDIVHTFPAVAGLRESFPQASIVWLTHPRWVKLVASSGLATEIWPVDSHNLSSVRTVVGRLRAVDWDAAIDYQGLWKAAFLPFFGGVRQRIGFSSKSVREYGVPILYTDRVDAKSAHVAEQNGELSVRAGACRGIAAFSLRVNEADAAQVQADLAKQGINRYVVLSPGGGWGSKCWPAERFGVLCERMEREMGVRCVVNYGPGERQLADAVLSSAGQTKSVVYDGELGPLMALLRNAECVVGGDTGPLHLAVALGTPVVALFGPTDPKRNGPFPPGDPVLRSANASTTYSRSNETDPSLLTLSVEAVFDAVKSRLGTRV
ncbi:MAG TPA: glycosyltransferase family 9 protein [Candidatus Saccharimonadales bacterium]|nr:glycosyltransferase family 9 protein [Candidatus Saccharimonadales bacterium]